MLKWHLQGGVLDLTENANIVSCRQRESLKTSKINAKNNNFTSSNLVMAA